MSEEGMKDCSIKLFGQTIVLGSPDRVVAEQRQSSSVESTSPHSKYASTTESKRNRHELEHESIINTSESPASPSSSVCLSEKTPTEDEPTESPSSHENGTLKKPDKLLPCPRCKSMDTKFCYYNNYNVKQPRHFCKNCQRYWTSGGTMRDVPIGSGRRKRKDAFAPDYRQITVIEARPDPTSGFLVFGPNAFHDHTGRALESVGFPLGFYPVQTTPGTLRIGDPSEAAKSNIWSTLGIKKEKIGSTAGKTCLFEAFGTKGNRNRGADNTTIVLQANPAAFSRSLNFHEHS